MKITQLLSALLLVLSLGCSTQKIKTDNYTWNVMLEPLEGDEYQLTAQFVKNSRELTQDSHTGDFSAIHVPPLKLRPEVPATASISGKNGTPVICSEACLNVMDEKSTIRYELRVNEDGHTHQSKGTITIQ